MREWLWLAVSSTVQRSAGRDGPLTRRRGGSAAAAAVTAAVTSSGAVTIRAAHAAQRTHSSSVDTATSRGEQINTAQRHGDIKTFGRETERKLVGQNVLGRERRKREQRDRCEEESGAIGERIQRPAMEEEGWRWTRE